MEVQYCRKCGRTKPIDAFYLNRRMRSGRFGACKLCVIANTQKWHQTHPERRGKMLGKPRGSQAKGFPPGVLLDDEDRARLEHYSWYNDRGYIRRRIVLPDGRVTSEKLHRVVSNCPAGYEADHVNGIGLDCRQANLRIVDHRSNTQNRAKPRNNTSGHLGVTWNKKRQRWLAYATKDKRFVSLGAFHNPLEAARVAHAYRETHYPGFTGRNVNNPLSARVNLRVATITTGGSDRVSPLREEQSLDRHLP